MALKVNRAAVKSTAAICISDDESALRARLELLLAHCEKGDPRRRDGATELVVRMLASLGGGEMGGTLV